MLQNHDISDIDIPRFSLNSNESNSFDADATVLSQDNLDMDATVLSRQYNVPNISMNTPHIVKQPVQGAQTTQFVQQTQPATAQTTTPVSAPATQSKQSAVPNTSASANTGNSMNTAKPDTAAKETVKKPVTNGYSAKMSLPEIKPITLSKPVSTTETKPVSQPVSKPTNNTAERSVTSDVLKMHTATSEPKNKPIVDKTDETMQKPASKPTTEPSTKPLVASTVQTPATTSKTEPKTQSKKSEIITPYFFDGELAKLVRGTSLTKGDELVRTMFAMLHWFDHLAILIVNNQLGNPTQGDIASIIHSKCDELMCQLLGISSIDEDSYIASKARKIIKERQERDQQLRLMELIGAMDRQAQSIDPVTGMSYYDEHPEIMEQMNEFMQRITRDE